AFQVTAEGRTAVVGRRVVLVDDVYTTGATVSACTLAPRRGGAVGVDVLTFARADGDNPLSWAGFVFAPHGRLHSSRRDTCHGSGLGNVRSCRTCGNPNI